MTDSTLKVWLDRDSKLLRLRLNQPKANLVDAAMIAALDSALSEHESNPDISTVLLDAEGPHFSFGASVEEHLPDQCADMLSSLHGLIIRMLEYPVPILAAVQGQCLGGGLEVVCGASQIFAASNANFGQPEIKLGFFPPYAAIRLPNLVGEAKAIEICTTGKRYTAKEAKSMGFVSHTVEDEMFSEAVDKMVNEIQSSSPLIIRLNKRAVKQHLGLKFSKALQGVEDLFLNTLMKTEDTAEGICSFEEKRKPLWKNR